MKLHSLVILATIFALFGLVSVGLASASFAPFETMNGVPFSLAGKVEFKADEIIFRGITADDLPAIIRLLNPVEPVDVWAHWEVRSSPYPTASYSYTGEIGNLARAMSLRFASGELESLRKGIEEVANAIRGGVVWAGSVLRGGLSAFMDLFSMNARAAITFTNQGSSANPDINSTTDASSYANSSWTPPTSGLIIVFVVNARTPAGVTPTVSGNSVTWVQIATGTFSSYRMTLFGANASGSSAGATTFSFAGQTQSGLNASFFRADGADQANGVAQTFIQTQFDSTTSVTSFTITMATESDSNNRPISSFMHAVNEGTTPGTNWTELDDLANSTVIALESQFRGDAFQTTASASWATSSLVLGMAAEIKVSGSCGANRFWIGGTGSWSNTAKWAATSGGSGPCPVPTSIQSVIIDAASCSGACTITVDVNAAMASLSTTGFNDASSTLAVQTFNFAVSGNITYNTSNLAITVGISATNGLTATGTLTMISGANIACGAVACKGDIEGNTSLDSTSFFDFGSSTWNFGGTWTNNTTTASWDAGTGTTTFDAAVAGTMIFAGANLSEDEFSSATFNSTGGTAQTFTMATRSLRIGGTLTITDSSSTTTLNTANLNLQANDVECATNGIIQIGTGDFLSLVTFNIDGSLTMDGQTIGNMFIQTGAGTIDITAWTAWAVTPEVDVRWTFNPSSAGATITFTLEETAVSSPYEIFRDSISLTVATSNVSGSVTFTVVAGWSSHAMKIAPFRIHNSLIKQTAEAAGANCAFGGQKIESGLDNGDGGGTADDFVLQAGEVDAMSFVCNGVSSLVSTTTTVEPPGANCANGGTKITFKSGLDNGDGGGTAGDGILQAGEVDQTTIFYSCKGDTGAAGANGFNSLVDTTTAVEAPGANCANGGTKVTFKSGLDNGDGGGTANNGILEAGEVDQTTIFYSCTGATGATGASGFNSLVKTTTAVEGAGANCANGGTKITFESGLDNGDGGGTANDGILQAGEVDATTIFYSCKGDTGGTGASGANGHNSVTKQTVEPVGVNCADGGFKFESGIDDGSGGGTADDGILQAGEVDFTSYACNGADGFNSVTLQFVEAPGANCADGGFKYQSGIDDGSGGGTAGDDILQAGEIDFTSYACNGATGPTGPIGPPGAAIWVIFIVAAVLSAIVVAWALMGRKDGY